VLDNLEQLAPGAAVLGGLLAAAPGLRLLTTSREPLRLAGEQQYEVPVLEAVDAVELFSARAHSVAPRLTVDPDLTGRICERLDRLPLAIELAAARVKTLQPGEILTRLEQGLPVLATGPRDAARRQQTLTATIDWSYDLLAVEEQRLFARLSVFAGGFTFAAAEAICDADLDTLQALTDRSLLKAEDGRYTMLQTLREYALGRLERSAEGDELRRRHADCYAGLLRGETDWDGSQSPILPSRPVELENLRAALEWAAARGETETVAQLTVLSCQWAWSRLGRLDEAERWLRFSCEHQDGLPLSLRAAVMSERMELLHKRGEHAAGAAFCEQALVMYRELEDHDGIMWSLNSRSAFASERGDFAGARSALEEQIVHARVHNRPGWVPGVLCNLADVAILEGNLDEARAFCEKGLALVESLGKTRVKAYLLVNLADVANRRGRHSNAARCGHEALTASIDHEDLFIAAAAMMQIGWSLAVEGEPEQAARFLGTALGFNEDAGATLQQTDRVCQQRTYEILSAQFDEPTLRTLLDEGRKVPVQDAIADALDEASIVGT
jgi:predicted ATPase